MIKGDLKAVKSALQALVASKQSVWVEVKLQQSFYLSDMQAELNSLISESKVEILKITSPKVNENSQWLSQEIETLDALTPIELFQYRLDCEDNLSELQQVQLKTLFAQSCAELEKKA